MRFVARHTVEHAKQSVEQDGESTNRGEELLGRHKRTERGIYLNIEPKHPLDYASAIAWRSDTYRMDTGRQDRHLLSIALRNSLVVLAELPEGSLPRGKQRHRVFAKKPLATAVPTRRSGTSAAIIRMRTNNMQVYGNTASQPEYRQSKTTGKGYYEFRLAESQRGVDTAPTWYTVRMMKDSNPLLDKGDFVKVTGKLKTDFYLSREGKPTGTLLILAFEATKLARPASALAAEQAPATHEAEATD